MPSTGPWPRGSAGWCWAPTAPARRRCSRSRRRSCTRPGGGVEVLGERLGRGRRLRAAAADRAGVSAALAERIPRRARPATSCVTASYAVTGRWRERYDGGRRHAAPRQLLAAAGRRPPGRADLRDAVRGGAQAGPDRARADGRPRAAPARRAGRRSRPRRSRGPGARGWPSSPPTTYAPTTVLVTHHVEEIPPGFTHALLLRAGAVVAAGPIATLIRRRRCRETFGLPLTTDRAQAVRHAARLVPVDLDCRHSGRIDQVWMPGAVVAVAALLLGVAEVATTSLVFGMLAGGALRRRAHRSSVADSLLAAVACRRRRRRCSCSSVVRPVALRHLRSRCPPGPGSPPCRYRGGGARPRSTPTTGGSSSAVRSGRRAASTARASLSRRHPGDVVRIHGATALVDGTEQ